MKKLLLSTSALVGVGLVAAPSFGAERVKLAVGGYMEQYIGFVDAENDARVRDINSFDNQSDTEVYFKGKTTLDNGITFAANVELEADESSGGTIDESYLQVVSPTLGELRLGGDDAANAVMVVQANRGMSGDYDNWIVEVNMTKNDNLYDSGASSDDNKVSYFSPKIMGFQLGLSYVPSTTNAATDTDNSIGGAGAAWAAAFTYDNKFGDVGVKVGAGTYREAHAAGGGVGMDSWNAGAQLAYQGFTLSGGAAKTQQLAPNTATGTSTDGSRYQVGLQYATGPYTVGVWHMHNENQGLARTAGDDETDVVSVYGSYVLSDGIKLEGMVFNVDYDEETKVDANSQAGGWGVVAGFRLDF